MSFLPDVNVSKIAGVATAVNSGNQDNGTQRVVLATDQPALTNKLLVTPDLPTGASTDASITETHGTKAAGTAATKSDLVGMVAASAAPAPTDGQQIALQGDLLGNLRINPTGNVGSFQAPSSTPSAGSNLAMAVPAGQKWIVRSLRIRLVTSSQIASRVVSLRVVDASANVLVRRTAISAVNTEYTQAASLSKDYCYGVGYPDTYSDTRNEIFMGIPLLVLGPGFSLLTVVTSIQTGDQVSAFANVEAYSD